MTTTWSGSHTFGAATVHRPRTLEELQELVAVSRRVRALGSRHSFNDLADSPGDLVVLDALAATDGVAVDPVARTATAPAGMRYGELARELHARGWALHAMASLPHIGLAGAVATATHGSGDHARNLAAGVAGLELVGADGTLRVLDRGDDELAGSVVALGALGVVTRVTFDVEPTYDVAQTVDLDLPWDAALEHFDEITASADSVSLFTDWSGPAVQQVWRKARVRAGDERAEVERYGARPATAKKHPIAGIDPVACTPQLGEPGPWHERLPHFRLDFTPSSGDELQSEYLLPRRHAAAALAAVRALSSVVTPLLLVSEVRTVAADDLWLSTAHGVDTVALHFTWKQVPEVAHVLPTIEDALAPFDARPHWGKLFADRERDLARLYPRWDDFRALVARRDPGGVFTNDFLARHVL
ncbi:D-arabinono-1,4-lactone oxidase [Cellulomonas alba]|uniref:D-arabinono-1,4-lactone oxidase n=1 Tax=Cellulomonas alba TaxID=3053467 RepID=A0ABT7SHE6_9CELL|nr:D-arabinono-1,4-lactone oxidase [Cellulomonas alba]MDM7855610.1 D-arabinono-1,4-lactone oxidase [Cellulomonas alba]